MTFALWLILAFRYGALEPAVHLPLILSAGPRSIARLWGYEEEIGAFVARIADGISRHRAGTTHVDVDALCRGGRDSEAWLDALPATVDARASFRSPALPPAVLLRVVEDATQHEDARVGAALALRDTLDDESRARIRAAAGACASTELRHALEAAAAEDDARLVRALDAVGRPGR